ncbi:MAG TPA: hypothetical protein VFS88_09755 [Micavibrio sp.]|nr:hypothetical protein [Micavibrio sp.]
MSISTKTANPRKSSVIRAFLLCFLTVLLAAPAMAAIGVNIADIPGLKEYELKPGEEFEKTTKVIKQENPYGDSKISYEFRVPKKWSLNVQQAPIGAGEGGSPLSKSVLTIIAKYISEPKNLQRSTITIEAQELAYEISAKNWFINFIINNGYSLSGMTEKSVREIEALYVALENDVTYVVRTRVIINGSRLVVVRYYLPQENYEEEKVLQAQVMSSFRLLQPTKERIETQETYGFLDQSYFNYPKSWTLKEKSILSIERMSALLTQEMTDRKTQILEGHIKIKVISRLLKTTLAQEIENFRKDLKIPHYSVGKLIENVDYAYDPSIRIGKAQLYRLEPDDKVNMQAYEFLVTVMQGDDYYYITSLITPSREQDFYTWAKNMEAARIVNETMRRNNLIIQYDPNDPYFDYLKEYEAEDQAPSENAQ